MKKQEIFNKNPHEAEINEIHEYEKSSKEFFRILSGNLEKEDNFTELQLETIFEIINLFNQQILRFEREVANNPRAKQSFEIILHNKQKFYERILHRFAKYLSLICYGKLKNIVYINLKTLYNELKEAFDIMTDVVEKDIPKYNILFDDLNSLPNKNKKFEVYLGRDGIYAYEARRATDVAKRRELRGDDKNKREEIKINPKYINFNTLIKEHYSEEDRKRYLENNGIYPEQDLVIFDTGFTGSIPEQILKTLGFQDPDIDHRIKILGTHYYTNNQNLNINNVNPDLVEKIQSRLAKGLKPTYANYLHVDIIEERPKNTMSATGIYEDSNGKLKPAEKPYFDKAYFQYSLIELVIRQYYFNREIYQI